MSTTVNFPKDLVFFRYPGRLTVRIGQYLDDGVRIKVDERGTVLKSKWTYLLQKELNELYQKAIADGKGSEAEKLFIEATKKVIPGIATELSSVFGNEYTKEQLIVFSEN
jgi:hypothetical protein